VTQRSLSSELGVALGLTNLLIRRLAGKGYIKVSGMGTRHVRYLMTPSGWEALGHATRLSLENTIQLYTQTREQIRARLDDLSARCETDPAGKKRVIFYGAGDVAEIAYVSLQRTDLALVGVIDDQRVGRFFDMPIQTRDCLSAEAFDGVAYSHVIVASLRYSDVIQSRIVERGVPIAKVYCL
jgi:hypothetical protein